MKRFCLFLLSLLTIMPGFLSINIASAIDIEDSENEYWTLEDMEALSAESLNEVNELCDIEDRGCRNQYLRDRRNRGGIYKLLETFESRKLIITAVNPDSNKIRVVYYNELKRKKMMGQIEEPAELVHLYIGRVEYEDHNRSPWHEMISIMDGTGDYPEVHITLSWEASDENHVEFLPNVEQEFDMADDALLEGVRNVFYYELKDTSNNGGRDVYRLADCLANHQSGAECQIRFSSEGEVLYMPVEVKTLTTEVDNNPNEDNNENDDNNENTDENSNEDGVGEGSDDNENIDENNNNDNSESTDENSDEESHEPLNLDDESDNVIESDNKSIKDTEEAVAEIDAREEIEENHDVKEEIIEEIGEKISSEKENEEPAESEPIKVIEENGFGGEAIKESLLALTPTPKLKSQLTDSVASQKQNEPEISLKPVLTPETGQNTTPEEQENAEVEIINLPWIIGLSTASIAFAVWWFIPVSKKGKQ